VFAHLLEQSTSVHLVEGILQVDLEDALGFVWDGGVFEEGSDGMDDGLAAGLDADSHLQGFEKFCYPGRKLERQTLGNKTEEDFAHCNGPEPAIFLGGCKKVCAAEGATDGGIFLAARELTRDVMAESALSDFEGSGEKIAALRCSARKEEGPGVVPGLKDLTAFATSWGEMRGAAGVYPGGMVGAGAWGCFFCISE
jgi:hypothetical protein